MFLTIVGVISIVSFVLAVLSLIDQNRKSHIIKEAQKNLERGRVIYQSSSPF